MTERLRRHRETPPLSVDLCRLPRLVTLPVTDGSSVSTPATVGFKSDPMKQIGMDSTIRCRLSSKDNYFTDEISNFDEAVQARVKTTLTSGSRNLPSLERYSKHVSSSGLDGHLVKPTPIQRNKCSSSLKSSNPCLGKPKGNMTNKDLSTTSTHKLTPLARIRRTSLFSARSPSSPMGLAAILFAVLMTSVVLLPQAVGADWDSNCPANCKCTYVSNRKVAKCENAGYSTVPSLLSAEIQELVLSNNNIFQIDKDEFQKAGLVNLQRLVLSNNKITYLDKDAFSGLKILIELDLSNNRVDKLHPVTFTGMEKLRKLDLSGNELTRLEADQFPPLLHLQRLKLGNCNIRFAHNFAFRNLPNVTAIGLSNNALESVQSALFSQNPRLVSLELANNRWSCDCHLRSFARWMEDSEFFKNTNWNCFSPDRLKDAHWRDVSLEEFACEPTVAVTREIVSVTVGAHSELDCWATGDPLPTLQWVAEKRVLSNLTQIGDSTDHYVVHTEQNETGVFSTLELGIYGDHHPTEYTCVAKNPANNVEKTIKVVVGSDDALDIIDSSGPSTIILISIGVALIVLVILLIILIVCCLCRRRAATATPHSKLNGNAGEHGSVMVVAPGNSINPIGKPPRQYEKLPQKDVEMTHIVNPAMEGGAHRSFEDVNYSGGGNPSSNYGERARLPPLEEEGGMSTHHPASPYLVNQAAPSPTLTLQSNLTQTTTSHYPDLLDNARVPRTISPTQMSYQSPSNQDWRFSYAHPGTDYSAAVAPSEYARSPVAYSTPQHQRPGYVTLPRRPRAPSWSGVPSPHIVANPLLSPSGVPRETVYDTLGPRTTADGTSTTDLTRPGSRAALYEPFPPAGGVVVPTPTSPLGLAAHYTSMAAQKYNSPRHLLGQAKPGTSQTLPRSTPNLLDEYNLSIPQYRAVRKPQKGDPYSGQLQPVQNSEIEPLIEDPNLGIPYDPNYQFHPVNAADSSAAQLMNGEYATSEKQRTNNNNNSKNNYNNDKSSNGNLSKAQGHRPSDTLNRNMRSPSPAMSPSGNSSNRTLNISISPSPAPTPTQILSSASPHSGQTGLRPSPACTPNNNVPSSRSETPPGHITNGGGYPASPTSPTYTGPASPCSGPLVSPSPSSSSGTTSNSTSNKKKVPPRPPPKPSNKRLSVASVNSDSSGVALCRKASVTSGGGGGGGLYQDEGPDGSEV